MKKVLVTGGAGFIGGHLVRKLVDKGISVNVIDDLSTGKESNISNRANLFKGDIRDDKILKSACKDCEIIFHLAARVELQKSIADPADCFSVNVVGTSKLIENVLKLDNCKLLFASSCSVYPHDIKGSISEDIFTSGESPYAISKIACERLIKFYCSNLGLNACSLRFFNIYGPNQREDSKYAAVVPKFMNQAVNGLELILNGGGEQSRDFIHVDDVVNSYLIMAKQKKISGIYNVGTGISTSIKSLAEKINGFEMKSEIKYGPKLKGDAFSSRADINRIRDKSGFFPKVSLDDGLLTVYDYFKNLKK